MKKLQTLTTDPIIYPILITEDQPITNMNEKLRDHFDFRYNLWNLCLELGLQIKSTPEPDDDREIEGTYLALNKVNIKLGNREYEIQGAYLDEEEVWCFSLHSTKAPNIYWTSIYCFQLTDNWVNKYALVDKDYEELLEKQKTGLA